MQDTDPDILRWSLRAIGFWENTWIPPNITYIHGNKDKLIAMPQYGHRFIIEGGDHFIVVKRGKQISDLINEQLSKL